MTIGMIDLLYMKDGLRDEVQRAMWQFQFLGDSMATIRHRQDTMDDEKRDWYVRGAEEEYGAAMGHLFRALELFYDEVHRIDRADARGFYGGVFSQMDL